MAGRSIADAKREVIYPIAFSGGRQSDVADIYLADPALRKLAEFFEKKGIGAIKEEDRDERWHEDWIRYQAEHRLYASLLSPKCYSSLGFQFDLLKQGRFLEVIAYFSPAHGYSLQVTFLGLFSILMGANNALKKEAVAILESGGLLAFGASEQNHGSDLLANEFAVERTRLGFLRADGSKYYIGNANSAAMISVLGRMNDERSRGRRAPPVLFALRPKESKGLGPVRKIRTVGIRSAFVGEFEVKNHELPESDLIAEGRQAWDAVLGAVALGKFFLGFGSIGICERAFEEVIGHITRRILYGKPVIDMPHIGSATAQAYARLTAMKLYAYRAVDYVHGGSATDRRYLLFCAVQKAKVGAEGVKVISLLSECVGAKGFESDTYFEMALRDIQLIPRLEGSTHVNLSMAAHFAGKYLGAFDATLADPKSLITGEAVTGENSYLMEATAGGTSAVTFADFAGAFVPLKDVANAGLFLEQAKAFSDFYFSRQSGGAGEMTNGLGIGECLATIAYGQLIAENAARLDVPRQMISVIFHMLVNDLSVIALSMASSYQLDADGRALIKKVVAVPETSEGDWNFVLRRCRGLVD
jgi:acyl-CoA dehydrogenase